VFWKDEPAPFNVPLAELALVLVLALDEVLALAAEVLAAAVLAAAAEELDDDDEEHAARASAATAAPLTTAICFLPRNCISGLSL
jgi:hypothetical protein